MRWLCAALVVACAAPAAAQNATVPQGPSLPVESIAKRPIGITLSGGVSLGAYEAGFLHYTLGQLRRIGVRPRVLTGTSAGSINAFLGLLEACSTPPEHPTDSLLYKSWVPAGIEQLFDKHAVTATSIFTRVSMRHTIAALHEAWLAGLDADCDIELGTAVTLQKPKPLEVGLAGVNVPRMSERFLVRIRGRGKDATPIVTNARTAELGGSLVLLPLDGPKADSFGSLVDILLASSGFPLAFPPKIVRHCNREAQGDEVPRCTVDEAVETAYIDGGFFDNRPIGLAFSVLREQAAPGVDPALLFVDPSLYAWPHPDDKVPFSDKGVLGVVAHALFDFIDTAMSAELEHLLSHEPELARGLYLGMAQFPPASAPMGAFFGFIDEELRRFDFYLGMFNARRLTARVRGIATRDLGDNTDDFHDPTMRPVACLRALWDDDGDPKERCAGDDLVDFRILAQVMGEQVVNECLKSADGASSPHSMCVAAFAGRGAPRVPYVHQKGDPAQHGGEANYAWTMRRLGELGFWFRDLGLTRAQSKRGLVALRRKLGQIVDAFAAKQGTAAIAYQVLGEFGLNQLAYIPPQHLVHLAIGDRVEIGYSWTRPTSPMRWARLSSTIALRGLDQLLSSRTLYFGIAPTGGIELEPLPISRAWVQTRLALRAGYLFSTADNFLRGHCTVSSDRPCSGPLTEAVLTVSLLNAFRVQIAGTWLPAIHSGEKQNWAIAPAFGIQLPIAGP